MIDSEGIMGRRTEVRDDRYSVEGLLRLARTQKNNRASRRMLGIAHALGGMTISQAARAAGMERQALCDAIKRYNAEGLEGLFDRAKPGRPRKLDAAQEKELSELLVKGPDPDKDGISAYTLDDLVAIAENRWKVKYHPWSLSVAIKRLGFSRQKARPFHPEKDEAAQDALKGALPTLERAWRSPPRQENPSLFSG
jgi:transposase